MNLVTTNTKIIKIPPVSHYLPPWHAETEEECKDYYEIPRTRIKCPKDGITSCISALRTQIPACMNKNTLEASYIQHKHCLNIVPTGWALASQPQNDK